MDQVTWPERSWCELSLKVTMAVSWSVVCCTALPFCASDSEILTGTVSSTVTVKLWCTAPICAVICTVPGARPVSRPPAATLATLGSLDDQVACGLTLAWDWSVYKPMAVIWSVVCVAT